ncbi:hypothetical protein [Micromonospora sp. WMMD710]|uniref:hypothetical protein n=1 Tax=Micromonospora sp. WMMD710 TaxID=3016085 RepID=UPI0024165B6A|nr:hypothetical protein [Micromonospora sp. WMMD710]MDG4757291.1 hypothetical protein [Micromonospora sp. WMMD710]
MPYPQASRRVIVGVDTHGDGTAAATMERIDPADRRLGGDAGAGPDRSTSPS